MLDDLQLVRFVQVSPHSGFPVLLLGLNAAPCPLGMRAPGY